MTTRRWTTAIVVVAVVAFGVGIASAGSGGFGQPSGGNSTAAAMMGGMMGGAEPHMDGDMMAGQPTMRGDMGSMHAEMMAAAIGKVPAELLADCERLHPQMMSSIGGMQSGHGRHHLDSADG